MVMQKALPVMPISELRYRAAKILRLVKEQPVVLTRRGRASAVLVDFDAYNEMVRRQEFLEAARDALIIERALATSPGFVSFDELIRDYEEATGVEIDRRELLEAAKSV